jgi:hypothetical protein
MSTVELLPFKMTSKKTKEEQGIDRRQPPVAALRMP